MLNITTLLQYHLKFELVKVLFDDGEDKKYSVKVLSKDNEHDFEIHIYLNEAEYQLLKDYFEVTEVNAGWISK